MIDIRSSNVSAPAFEDCGYGLEESKAKTKQDDRDARQQAPLGLLKKIPELPGKIVINTTLTRNTITSSKMPRFTCAKSFLSIRRISLTRPGYLSLYNPGSCLRRFSIFG